MAASQTDNIVSWTPSRKSTVGNSSLRPRHGSGVVVNRSLWKIPRTFANQEIAPLVLSSISILFPFVLSILLLLTYSFTFVEEIE